MLFIVWGVLAIAAAISVATSTTSCTLSYQNIRTHGPVTDIDENTVPSTRINAEASLAPKLPGMK